MDFRKWGGLIVLLICLYILWQIKAFLLLLLTAVILANALNVLVVNLQQGSARLATRFNQPRLHLGRSPAVFLALFFVLFTLWLAFTTIIPPFIGQFQVLFEQLNSGFARVEESFELQVVKLEESLGLSISDQLPDLEELVRGIPAFLNDVLNLGWAFLSDSLKVLLNVLLLTALTLMFLADPQPYRQGFIKLFPSFYRRRVDEILRLCDEGLKGWIAGILFNMLCIGVLSYIGLLLLGLPLALPQAVLAGLLTFIPNIGPGLSVIPPILIALLESPWKIGPVVALFFVIQQIEGNILTPLIMARQISLLPAVTLLAQVLFAVTLQLGFWGLFLALPLAVIVQVVVREVLIKDILDAWTEQENQPSVFSSPMPEVSGAIASGSSDIEGLQEARHPDEQP